MKTVPLIHCATTSHTLGHPCLVSLLFMSSLYSTLFNSQNVLFTCLLSFFTAFTCNEQKIKLGHNAHIKISIHLRKGNSLSELYVGINNIYKFTLPEAVCCCLQTCNFLFR